MRFVVCLIFLISLSAPAFAADKYVFILSATGNPFWQTVADGVKETATTRGIDADIMMVSNDRASEEQLDKCMNALEMKPRAIIIASLNPPTHMTCLKTAQEAGIIIGDIDSNITVAHGKENGLDLAFSVGSDNTAIGKQAADYAADHVNNNAPKVLIIEGAAGSLTGQKRVKGFTDQIKARLPGSDIVASTSAEWDRLKAMNLVTDTLQRVPDLNIVFTANDGMGLGASEALKIAKKSGEITLVSVDGVKEGRDAVEAERMDATVAQLPYLMGKRAVELAIDAAEGKVTNADETLPTPVLTLDVLRLNEDPNLKYVR